MQKQEKMYVKRNSVARLL